MDISYSAFADELEKIAKSSRRKKEKPRDPTKRAIGGAAGLLALYKGTDLVGMGVRSGLRGHGSQDIKGIAQKMGIKSNFEVSTSGRTVKTRMGKRKIKIPGHGPFFYGDPVNPHSTPVVNVPRGSSEAVAAHELGHLKNFETRLRIGGKKWSQFSQHGQIAARNVGRYSAPITAVIAGGQDEPDYKAGLVNLAIHSPTLVEEARASGHALKHMVKGHGLLRGVKKSLPLLPAYGTYAMFGMAPLGITAARKGLRKLKEKKSS